MRQNNPGRDSRYKKECRKDHAPSAMESRNQRCRAAAGLNPAEIGGSPAQEKHPSQAGDAQTENTQSPRCIDGMMPIGAPPIPQMLFQGYSATPPAQRPI